MSDFLQIVAAIVVGGLLLIVLAFVALRLAWWYFTRKISKSFEGFADALKAGQMVPTELDLKALPDGELSPGAAGQVAELEKLGFTRAGAFRIEAADATLALLADPARSAWAAVNDAALTGVSVDVVSQHADGRWVTHMTLKDLGLEPPEGIVKVRVPDATVAELVERHLAERPGGREGEYRAATPENAEDALRRAVRDEGLLRALAGGLSGKELDANLKATDQDADTGQSAMVLAIARGQAVAVLDEAFAAEFRRTSTMNVDEWEQIEDELLIVHGMSDNEELARHLRPDVDEVEEEALAKELGDGEPKIGRFATLNAADEEPLRHLADLTIEAGPRTVRAAAYVGRDFDSM